MTEDEKDLIDKLTHIDPLKRLGMGNVGSGYSFQDLKKHKFFSENINMQDIEDEVEDKSISLS